MLLENTLSLGLYLSYAEALSKALENQTKEKLLHEEKDATILELRHCITSLQANYQDALAAVEAQRTTTANEYQAKISMGIALAVMEACIKVNLIKKPNDIAFLVQVK